MQDDIAVCSKYPKSLCENVPKMSEIHNWIGQVETSEERQFHF